MTRTPPPNTWRREPPQGWQEMERRAAAQAREFSRRGAPARGAGAYALPAITVLAHG